MNYLSLPKYKKDKTKKFKMTEIVNPNYSKIKRYRPINFYEDKSLFLNSKSTPGLVDVIDKHTLSSLIYNMTSSLRMNGKLSNIKKLNLTQTFHTSSYSSHIFRDAFQLYRLKYKGVDVSFNINYYENCLYYNSGVLPFKLDIIFNNTIYNYYFNKCFYHFLKDNFTNIKDYNLSFHELSSSKFNLHIPFLLFSDYGFTWSKLLDKMNGFQEYFEGICHFCCKKKDIISKPFKFTKFKYNVCYNSSCCYSYIKLINRHSINESKEVSSFFI